jgi:hypothetical protein
MTPATRNWRLQVIDTTASEPIPVQTVVKDFTSVLVARSSPQLSSDSTKPPVAGTTGVISKRPVSSKLPASTFSVVPSCAIIRPRFP